VVGKYIKHNDAYKSVYESLAHAGIALDAHVEVLKVEAEQVERGGAEGVLAAADGILVPGGFGYRGIAGKLEAIRHARERQVPFFGICLGLQCAVIEFARHVAGLEGANSTEMEPDCPHPVVCLLNEQYAITAKGGTMRLGAYPCVLTAGSRAHQAYGSLEICERHRHRYEFNNDYRGRLEAHGLRVTGTSPGGELVEVIELPGHPWFVAIQAHPEFKSKPTKAHPLFRAFVQASLARREGRKADPNRARLAAAAAVSAS
jgi:CTP synthase